jgi:hypothetical protein
MWRFHDKKHMVKRMLVSNAEFAFDEKRKTNGLNFGLF